MGCEDHQERMPLSTHSCFPCRAAYDTVLKTSNTWFLVARVFRLWQGKNQILFIFESSGQGLQAFSFVACGEKPSECHSFSADPCRWVRYVVLSERRSVAPSSIWSNSERNPSPCRYGLFSVFSFVCLVFASHHSQFDFAA